MAANVFTLSAPLLHGVKKIAIVINVGAKTFARLRRSTGRCESENGQSAKTFPNIFSQNSSFRIDLIKKFIPPEVNATALGDCLDFAGTKPPEILLCLVSAGSGAKTPPQTGIGIGSIL